MSRSSNGDATLLRDLLRQAGLEDFAPAGPVLPVVRTTSAGVPDPRPSRWASWGIPGKAIRLLERAGQGGGGQGGSGGDDWQETEAMQAVRALLDECHLGRVWGLLVGGLGAGKSTAAGWWLVNVRTRAGGPKMFVRSQDVAALPLGTVWAEERLRQLSDASALVLDDVGRKDAVTDPRTGEEVRRYLHPTVQRVLDARYDNRQPTLFTSNLHPTRDWLPYLDDERLQDRWREIGAARASREQSLRGREP